MKHLAVILEILLVVAAVWFFFPAQPFAPQPETGETLEKSFPPELVFRLAFWRHPSPEDRIFHADRREWSDAQGVTRWQAFLAIEPSPELRDWLATNPFSLATVPSLSHAIPNPPSWFPSELEELKIHEAPVGNMVLLIGPGGSPVYFADHGHGFARPAENPVPRPSPPVPANRLPNAPPPIPGA